jgi:hypothetical protein
VLHARTLLQVLDGELDGGVRPVEGIDVDRVTLQVDQDPTCQD